MEISRLGLQNSIYTKNEHSNQALEQVDLNKGILGNKVPEQSTVDNVHQDTIEQNNKVEVYSSPEYVHKSIINERPIQDFSFDFSKKNDINSVKSGNNSIKDIEEVSVSTMKKDDVLDQYKFFVKTSLVNDEDGSVRQVVRPKTL